MSTATPSSITSPKVYEALSSGVADGIFMPMETQKTLRLKEVVSHVLIMPGGLYYGSFALIASPAMLNKLSAADRKAVMSVSGAKLSQFAGVQWDERTGPAHSRTAASRREPIRLSIAARSQTPAQPHPLPLVPGIRGRCPPLPAGRCRRHPWLHGVS